MFARLTRTAIAFGVVLVLYQSYTLLAVPLLEPQVARKSSTGAASSGQSGRNAVSSYQRMLAGYFPPDHWALVGLPKVIKSGSVLLVVDDYDKDDRGRVNLTKVAAVLTPTPHDPGQPPPTDAVVLEAPGGALLQFDENFQPGRGRIGKIVSGDFPGPVTIRSGMREPGPHDDLLITTRDVRMNETMIFTPHDVNVRYGRSRASGRRMEIKLIPDETATGGGLKIAGVESIELFEKVAMELRPDQPQRRRAMRPASKPATLRGEAAAWGDSPGTGARAPVKLNTDEPVHITCSGSFEMNLTRFVATFRQRVHAWQQQPRGQADQLTCRDLRVYFGAGGDGAAVQIDPRQEPQVAERQKQALASLRPRRLEAVGVPVRVDSPSRDASARGGRLAYDFIDRLLTLDGGATEIRSGGNRVTAPAMRYRLPAEDSNAAIGNLWVAGPGRLVAAGPGRQPVEAEWNAAPGHNFPVTLLPDQRGQPVLTVLGKPRLSAPGRGDLVANQITMRLIETVADGPEGPALEVGGDSQALLPERIDADGGVTIDSPQLRAETETFAIAFHQRGALPGKRNEAAAGSSWSDNAPGGGGGGGGGAGADPSRTKYKLTTRRAELDVDQIGPEFSPAELRCLGAVDFRELSGHQRGEAPLRVVGDRLTANGLAAGQLQLKVEGEGKRRPATIAARGLTLHANEANVDQAKNRIWADGAGDAHFRTSRDLLGQATGAATDINLQWRDGWVFDGQRITVRGEVHGEAAHDWVRTGELVATLSRPINLADDPGSAAGTVEIRSIECRRGVTADHLTVDAGGQRSQERVHLKTAAFNLLTGEFSGTGPGWVRSIRLTEGGSPLAKLDGRADNPSSAGRGEPSRGEPSLNLLRVHFQQAVSGRWEGRGRFVQFDGRVRSIYAPVLAWQDDMPVTPSGPLPPDAATLQCDQLRVNEDPLASRLAAPAGVSQGTLAPLELTAVGHVRLEGASDDGGSFNAQSSRASYNQLKELFVLEGDGRSPANLWLRKSAADGWLKHPSGRIAYWRKTGIVQTENFGATEYTPAATATRPATQR
ncbi:MAG: hypothetical protein AAGJ46_00865 [Planctomycetota bacterium]